MPDERATLSLERTFSEDEYGLLSLGHIPQEMEDRWFAYLDGDWLSFHRSWTGYCIYQVRLARESAGYRVAEAWVNRDPDQYPSKSDESDVAILSGLLIDGLLLQKRLGADGLREMLRHFQRAFGSSRDAIP
jgi:hypothetical protein